MLRRKLYSADRRLVEAAESRERMSATRQNANLMKPIIIHKARECVWSHPVEVEVDPPAETVCMYKPLTVAPEHMDVQLLKEVHDERVDLWQQPDEEDDGKTQSEDCRETKSKH